MAVNINDIRPILTNHAGKDLLLREDGVDKTITNITIKEEYSASDTELSKTLNKVVLEVVSVAPDPTTSEWDILWNQLAGLEGKFDNIDIDLEPVTDKLEDIDNNITNTKNAVLNVLTDSKDTLINNINDSKTNLLDAITDSETTIITNNNNNKDTILDKLYEIELGVDKANTGETAILNAVNLSGNEVIAVSNSNKKSILHKIGNLQAVITTGNTGLKNVIDDNTSIIISAINNKELDDNNIIDAINNIVLDIDPILDAINSIVLDTEPLVEAINEIVLDTEPIITAIEGIALDLSPLLADNEQNTAEILDAVNDGKTAVINKVTETAYDDTDLISLVTSSSQTLSGYISNNQDAIADNKTLLQGIEAKVDGLSSNSGGGGSVVSLDSYLDELIARLEAM